MLVHRSHGAAPALLLAIVLLGGAGPQGHAQEVPEMPVPIERQATLISRIVQFDHGFAERAVSEVVVAVVYQGGFRVSFTARAGLTAALEAQGTIGGKPVRVVAIELDGDRSIGDALAESGASVAYVTPLRTVGLDPLVEATRRLDVLSFTGVPAYVYRGLAVGISLRSERPEILINLGASRQEGARLSSELLKLSRLVDSGGGNDR